MDFQHTSYTSRALPCALPLYLLRFPCLYIIPPLPSSYSSCLLVYVSHLALVSLTPLAPSPLTSYASRAEPFDLLRLVCDGARILPSDPDL